MRFLIVRTDIRAAADDDLAAAFEGGRRLRDEQTSPEPRRQVFRAEDRDAALLMARALASVGAVRSGRQRVKVLPIGEPQPCPWPTRTDAGSGPTAPGQPGTPAHGQPGTAAHGQPGTAAPPNPPVLPGAQAPPQHAGARPRFR